MRSRDARGRAFARSSLRIEMTSAMAANSPTSSQASVGTKRRAMPAPSPIGPGAPKPYAAAIESYSRQQRNAAATNTARKTKEFDQRTT
jgi:hypothetical protein